jgi:hypothetical protein
MIRLRVTKSAAVLAALFFLIGTENAVAQNTGGVFSPAVDEGHRSAQYRLGFDPDSDAFAQRFHYQQSLNGEAMWRVLAQARKTPDSDVDFDFVQGELFWDITNESRYWRTGMRFDVRIRDRGRPATVGVHWMNQFQLAPDWQARLVALTFVDIGDGAADGVGLQTRANVTYTVSDKQSAGLEMFSAYGTTDNFADLDEQRHQLGPFTNVSFGDGWSLFAGALFGLTGATPDTELRLWLTRGF